MSSAHVSPSELLAAVSAISRRRPDLVGAERAQRLVDAGWMEWQNGALRITSDGVRVCDAALSVSW